MESKIFTFDEIEQYQNHVAEGIANIEDSKSLLLLLKSIPASYRPTEPIVSMAVGIGGASLEGTIIRSLHKIKFNAQDIYVVGCEKDEKKGVIDSGDYDLEFRGAQGDATCTDPWFKGLESYNKGYDFIFMHHPSLPNFEIWWQIYSKALLTMNDKGIIATVSQGDEDRQHLKTLCEDINCKSNIHYFHYKGFIGREDYTIATMQRS